MKCLVTGGAGFIGSHLVEALLAAGDEVYVIDDLSTGAIANLDAVREHPRLHCTVDTVRNEPVLAELIDRVDIVYHLAAAVGVQLIVQRPVETIETNISGTELVLTHAAKKNKSVLLTSTSEVYGKSTKIPFCENDDMVLGATTRSRWSYACSKAVDEFLCLSYHRERGLPAVIVRLFNTVGPRQVGHYGMVVPRLIGQALSGGPITVYGDGEQSRCFCYVDDVVTALIALSREPRAHGEVFNLGSSQEVSINGLADAIQRVCGTDVEVVHIPYEEAYVEGFEDMRRRVPDVTKAHDLVGFSPKVALDEILRRVADHLRGSGIDG